MIRTAVFAALALGALAAPAFAFETQSAPAPHVDAAFTNLSILGNMMPGMVSEAFHFGPAEAPALAPDQPAVKKPTVVYELNGDKSEKRIDVVDPRDNPFMPQFERSASPSQVAR